MANIKETQLVKIPLPDNANTTFRDREKHMNVEIQKCIDEYNKKGYMVIEKTAVNKTSTHATIKFIVQRIF
jgi:hypothetical protein